MGFPPNVASMEAEKKDFTKVQTSFKSEPLDGFCLLRQSRMETSFLWRLGKVGGGAGTQTSSPYSLMRKTTGHRNLYDNLFYSILVISTAGALVVITV